MSSFRILLIILACSLTVACKIEIVVPEGGSVRSDSGAYICSPGQNCTVDVVDAFFQETFRAIPDEGYEFTNWKRRKGGFCGGKSRSPCTLSTAVFEGNDLLMGILASDLLFYLQPIFVKSQRLTSLSTGTSHSCVLEGDEPVCWGDNEFGQLNAPTLKNPTRICAGGQHTCALDAEGVKCWGAGSIVDENNFKQSGQSIVPGLSNPRSLSCGLWTTCAIDDEGAKCWGLHGENTTPIQAQPTKVSAGINAACSITDNAAQCEVAEFEPVREMTNEPVLIAPIDIDVGKYNACAIDRDGVVCWGTSEALKNVPPLNNPSQLEVGEGFACALDDNGVTCWGGEEYVSAGPGPIMQNPRSISVGDYNACAFDGEAVVCWYDPGAFGEGDVPDNLRPDQL